MPSLKKMTLGKLNVSEKALHALAVKILGFDVPLARAIQVLDWYLKQPELSTNGWKKDTRYLTVRKDFGPIKKIVPYQKPERVRRSVNYKPSEFGF